MFFCYLLIVITCFKFYCFRRNQLLYLKLSLFYFCSPPIGSKSKMLGPQWDIMAKRMSEQGRTPSAMQDNEVHELD